MEIYSEKLGKLIRFSVAETGDFESDEQNLAAENNFTLHEIIEKLAEKPFRTRKLSERPEEFEIPE